MLKLGGVHAKDGEPGQLMVIGLSHKNLERLKAGQPIMAPGSDWGLPGNVEVIIFSGETEQAMAREFADLVGADTRVKIDPRLRD